MSRSAQRPERFFPARRTWLRRLHIICVVLTVATLCAPAPAWAEVVTLKNGVSLEGGVAKIATFKTDPAKAGGGTTGIKQIVFVDDELRRVFFGANQQATLALPPPKAFERIKIPQRVCSGGFQINAVGPYVRVQPFDDQGRRLLTMLGPEGHIDVVQGITEITPTYTIVEGLQLGTGNGVRSYIWETRIATSSIPRDTLSKILMTYLDRKSPDDRLRIVRLYIQSDRYSDARAELLGVMKDFPELDPARLKEQETALLQAAAQRILKEVKLRRDAGQPELAYAMLKSFPGEGVAGEIRLQVRELIAEMDGQKEQGASVVKLMQEHFAALADDKSREEVKPICEEIAAELSVHTLDRMADYLRLSSDAELSAEKKLSLAISGWLLGNGSGMDNLAVSKSLYQVRNLVRIYLSSPMPAQRAAAYAKITSLEGGTPPYIARLIAHMKPPLDPLSKADAPVPAPLEDPGDILDLKGRDLIKEAIKAADAKPADKTGKAKNGKAKTPVPEAKKGEGKETRAEEAVPPIETINCGPGDNKAVAGAAGKNGAKNDIPGAGGIKKIGDPGDSKPAAKAPLKDDESKAADADKPAAADSKNEAEQTAPVLGNTGIPGLYELEAKGPSEHPNIKYFVQLPPEYDPYRRYPVIVTLNGAGTSPQQQIDWWAGSFDKGDNTRYGQATRHGYIVMAPVWQREHQRKYEFSAGEHAAVLNPLRDVCRRFAVDTDRVFLSGHSMGGDAAWDLGLAHPDLWAGVIPIVAEASKYIGRYPNNPALLPMYFICGELDGNKLAANATEWDRYLKHDSATEWDIMIVQYRGRGHESYHDEIQNLFDWMNQPAHRRNFFPKKFEEMQTLRPWDNFFWYVEFTGLPVMILPAEWTGDRPPTGRLEMKVTGSYGNDNEGNSTVRVSCGAKGPVSVWLAPEMVDFSKKTTVIINGKSVRGPLAPNLSHLLEDVRLRGDRQHPFWLKVSNR